LKIPIILILAVLWAAFFAWPFVQRRLSGRSRNSIGDFSRRVSALGNLRRAPRGRGLRAIPAPRAAAFKVAGPPVAAGLPMSSVAQKRRRDALGLFCVAALASLLLAFVVGGTVLWLIQIVADALLVGFLAALALIARRSRTRRASVHYLPQPAPAHSSALVLRRTASS